MCRFSKIKKEKKNCTRRPTALFRAVRGAPPRACFPGKSSITKRKKIRILVDRPQYLIRCATRRRRRWRRRPLGHFCPETLVGYCNFGRVTRLRRV